MTKAELNKVAEAHSRFWLIGRPNNMFRITWMGFYAGIACVKGETMIKGRTHETLARLADVSLAA